MKKIIAAILLLVVIVVAIFLAVRGRHKTVVVVTPKLSYVALGDSVAAGVGLPTASDSSACDRTNEAYPNLTAQTLNYNLKNIACSGASITAGIIGPQDVNELSVAPQISQLFEGPKPNLISLTIGANDVGWLSILSKCYLGACGSATDSASIDQKLAQLNQNLNTTLTQIRDHYKDTIPHVIITGYYQVFPDTAISCADMIGIDSKEVNWTKQQEEKLNNTIKSAASSFTFAKFAPVDFKNHELCTTSSWVQGIAEKQPYHPTTEGQAAIAKEVVLTEQSFK